LRLREKKEKREAADEEQKKKREKKMRSGATNCGEEEKKGMRIPCYTKAGRKKCDAIRPEARGKSFGCRANEKRECDRCEIPGEKKGKKPSQERHL